jgi:hypothetical protein
LQPLDLRIIHALKYQYKKATHTKGSSNDHGGLLGDASKLKINLLTTLHFIAEACRQIIPATIENCFMKCGFFIRW